MKNIKITREQAEKLVMIATNKSAKVCSKSQKDNRIYVNNLENLCENLNVDLSNLNNSELKNFNIIKLYFQLETSMLVLESKIPANKQRTLHPLVEEAINNFINN